MPNPTLELVALHITNVCSHRCPYCYLDNPNVKQKHPKLDKLIEIVDALGTAEIKELCYLGGDPASYPNVYDLSKYAKLHFDIKISILSNTLTFRGHSEEAIAEYIDAFETTIHHVEPELHDEFCKREGAYHGVVSQLRKFHELERKIGIAINIIPDIHNQIFKLVAKLVEQEKVNLDYIVIQRIIPFGRAAGSSTFTLSRQHAEDALQQIKKVDEEFGISITVEDPFPLCLLSESLKKYMSPCQWGITKAAVNSKGDLSRCGADPRYRIGNILETPLKEIWQNSEILKSFRSKNYLPGRCSVCPDLYRCSGGCPLSCEIEKDHGIDYLLLEYEKFNVEIHGKITFTRAKIDELSSILQIEWSDFPEYDHIFTVDSLLSWYKHNPNMFWVVKDSLNWILGYAALIPISEKLFKNLNQGKLSSLVQFPEEEVYTYDGSDYYHIEVLASVPSKTARRAGRYLIKSIGNHLLEHAKYISASPVNDIGLRLCKYFDFKHVANEKTDEYSYPIYIAEVDEQQFLPKLQRF